MFSGLGLSEVVLVILGVLVSLIPIGCVVLAVYLGVVGTRIRETDRRGGRPPAS